MSWGLKIISIKVVQSNFLWMTSHLIHESKNDLWIRCKASGKGSPETCKLGCGGSFRISCIANDASGCWLLGGIIISHIVVGIQDAVGTFGDRDVVYSSCELGVILEKL